MKKALFIIIIISIGYSSYSQELQPKDSILEFVSFLKNNNFLSPKEYLLKSFNEKDIIVLSERLHPEFTQYEMIINTIKDKRFKGDIYTEVGIYNKGKEINEFLKKERLTESEVNKEILNIYKNIDYTSLWPMYNYYYLIKSIYEINQSRDQEEKIFLHPLDVIFDWNTIKCKDQYQMFDNMLEPQNGFPALIERNRIMGEHFVVAYSRAKYFNKNKIKALVILNTYHGYTRIPRYLPNPTEPSIYSAAEYIFKTYPNTTKGILLNGYSFSNISKYVAGGKWDATFRITGNKNLAFDFKGTPFGKTQFDMYNFGGSDFETVNFEYIFDGFIFYKPIDYFQVAIGIPGIFNDSSFVEEFYRRVSFEENISLEQAKSSDEIKEMIKEYNVLKKENIMQNKYVSQQIKDFNDEVMKWIKK